MKIGLGAADGPGLTDGSAARAGAAVSVTINTPSAIAKRKENTSPERSTHSGPWLGDPERLRIRSGTRREPLP
jgi:hypothetical protein